MEWGQGDEVHVGTVDVETAGCRGCGWIVGAGQTLLLLRCCKSVGQNHGSESVWRWEPCWTAEEPGLWGRQWVEELPCSRKTVVVSLRFLRKTRALRDWRTARRWACDRSPRVCRGPTLSPSWRPIRVASCAVPLQGREVQNVWPRQAMRTRASGSQRSPNCAALERRD